MCSSRIAGWGYVAYSMYYSDFNDYRFFFAGLFATCAVVAAVDTWKDIEISWELHLQRMIDKKD